MFRRVTDEFSVSPQIGPADLDDAKTAGFHFIINNRPDGEASGQPTSESLALAARDLGLDYLHIPINGMPTIEKAAEMHRAIARHRVKTLAFCRSGTRSIITWAIGELAAGRATREDLLHAAAAAGYDLRGALPE